MRPIILMYHSITTNEPVGPYGVSIRSFHDQISWLVDHDYQFISLTDLVQSRLSARGEKQIVLNFDDGYRDFLTNALPILAHYRLTATVFLITGLLGQTSVWDRMDETTPLMTEMEIRQIKKMGISLGSHTVNHADLTLVGSDELQRQLTVSKKVLSDLGETFFSFSYPWGRYTRREVAAVKSVGYECAVAVGEQTEFFRPDVFRLGRLVMHQNLDIETFKHMVNKTWLRSVSDQIRAIRKTIRKKMGSAD